MLAMVLSALAPTLAQAVVASSGGAQWVEVCSASGMVWVKADAGVDAEDPQSSGHSALQANAAMACVWCSVHGGAAGLPPSVGVSEPQLRQAERLPAFFYAAALAGVWAVAQARAPPVVA